MNKLASFPALLLLCVAGCYTEHKIETVHEIKPIHITLDVNLKIDRELEKSFSKQDDLAKDINLDEAEKALREYEARNAPPQTTAPVAKQPK